MPLAQNPSIMCQDQQHGRQPQQRRTTNDDDDDDDVSGDGTNSNNDVENGDFVDTVAPVDVTMVDPNDDEDNDGGDDDNNDIEIDVEQGEVVVEEASDNGSNEFAVVDAEDETQDASVSCEEETKEEDHV
mmetsp:Transcript_3985/g.11262  ORF Transcript_3985/g.11262 Transcript_3985/m.11262 type:complete len:130 (+) Transcript_3985:160-549(+)